MKYLQTILVTLLFIIAFQPETYAQVYRTSTPAYRPVNYRVNYPVVHRVVYPTPRIIYYPPVVYQQVIIYSTECSCPNTQQRTIPQLKTVPQVKDNGQKVVETPTRTKKAPSHGIDQNGVPVPGGWYSAYKK